MKKLCVVFLLIVAMGCNLETTPEEQPLGYYEAIDDLELAQALLGTWTKTTESGLEISYTFTDDSGIAYFSTGAIQEFIIQDYRYYTITPIGNYYFFTITYIDELEMHVTYSTETNAIFYKE